MLIRLKMLPLGLLELVPLLHLAVLARGSVVQSNWTLRRPSLASCLINVLIDDALVNDVLENDENNEKSGTIDFYICLQLVFALRVPLGDLSNRLGDLSYLDSNRVTNNRKVVALRGDSLCNTTITYVM